MNIQAEKLELMKMLLETNDLSILKTIKSLLKKEDKSDFWNELSVSQQEEIHKADQQIKKGEVSNYDDFINEHL